MKSRLMVMFLIVSLFSLPAFSGEEEFRKGSLFLTPQVALYSYAPNFGVSLEYGLTENIGIGAGILLAFWSDDLMVLGKIKETLVTPSVDAYYHFTKIAAKKLDIFVGASLGFSIYSWSWDWAGDNWADAGASGLYLSPFAGVRYFLAKKLAISLKAHFSVLGDWSGLGGVLGLAIRLK